MNFILRFHLQRSKQSNDTKDHLRFLSATFADIPAPELQWEQMQSAPVPRLDGYSVQINNLLYVFSGYGNLDYVRACFLILYEFLESVFYNRFE